jgi:benzoyl-CoA reductase/2-hydroxyglutaryl-CoA dehydratase subunit BcrC/BadD/HgdB
MVHCIYNGSVKERIQMAEKLAKQTDADGGILFAHWGCKGTIGASGLIKNVLETAGLPTMILDGDGCNPANTSDGQVSTRLQAFAEMLEKNKEEKHS